jgi:hypothetical protein
MSALDGARGPSRGRDLANAFSIATLALALPVYQIVFHNPGVWRLARLVLIFQVIPTLLLFLFAHDVLPRLLPRVWIDRLWALLALGALSSALGLDFVNHQSLEPQSRFFGLKVGALVVLAATVVFLAWRSWRSIPRLFQPVAPGCVLLTAFFLISTLATRPSEGVDAPAAPTVGARADNVYVLLFDELGRDVLTRSGVVDAKRFPNLAGLASDGLWLSDATANYWETCRALPSLFSGHYLGVDGAPVEECGQPLAAGEPNLLRTLSEHYRVSVFSQYPQPCGLTAPHTCVGFTDQVAADPLLGFPLAVPAFARETTEQVVHWPFAWRPFGPGVPEPADFFRAFERDALTGPPVGRAFYVHLGIPHHPYVFAPDGSRHGSPFVSFRGDLEYDRFVRLNYERQVMLVDALVGEFVGALRAAGRYDTATIVVTGDQGPRPPDSFVGDRYPSEIGAETVNIPLLIRSPGLPPGISSVDYQHVDLFPTLLDVLHLDGPPVDGVSALRTDRPARPKRFEAMNRPATVRLDVTRWFPLRRTWMPRVYVREPGSGRWIAQDR